MAMDFLNRNANDASIYEDLQEVPDTMRNRPCILALMGCYLPGFRAGGPLRTIYNIVDNLHDEFDFHILTADRDLGEMEPYPGIEAEIWHKVGHAKVRYLKPVELQPANLWRIIGGVDHDLLYLNSFFSSRFTVVPLLGRRLGRLPGRPVLLAPRGEFSRGALGIKPLKKKIYLPLAKLGGLVKGVHWEATSVWEVADIKRTIGTGAEISVANNLASPPTKVLPGLAFNMDPTLHVTFISRISPMKNLEYALSVLQRVSVPLVFNIYGPQEDLAYWARCVTLIDQLPSHVKSVYHGPVRPEQVSATMAANDLFFLPTRGENFGHVIAEALSVGTPVLISDQTPWRNLALSGLGDDLPLSDPSGFVRVIEAAAARSLAQRRQRRLAVHAAMRARWEASDDVLANRQMFRNALGINSKEG